MGKRGGTVCAVKTCSNKTSNKSVKWHRFPKDIARARIWITACDREDLHHKSADELYNNYRVCSLHFEANMYANPLDLLNRLLPTAVPTIFPGMESSSGCKRKATEDECTSVTKIHKLSDSRTIPENTCIGVAVENVEMSSKICSAIVDPSSVTLSETCVPVYEPLCVNVDDCEESIPPALTSPVSTQTPISLTAHTPRKKKLRQTVTELRKEKEELRRENIMTTTVEQSEENLEHFMRLCNHFLPESMISLIQLQAQLHDKKPKGRRYPNEYKEFALSLYFLGPRAYKFLSTIMYLPTIRSLHRMTEAVVVQAGLQNDILYDTLKIKANALSQKDKYCLLCIDEMSIKANLFYVINRDEIIGFQDHGNGKRFQPARNALVIMARGLDSNWKQAVAYFFSCTSVPALELRTILQECVGKFSAIGLTVAGIVSDMGSNFIQLANILGVTAENPQFSIGHSKLVYLFDTPHLIKATRNNMLQHYLLFHSGKTSWKYIEQFYEKDKTLRNRCAPKLTPSHIYPTNFNKMKVKYATQVLSHSVACGMSTFIAFGQLPNEAMHTVDVIESFNKLFDMLNSSVKKGTTPYHSAFTGDEFQLDFLSSMSNFIRGIKIISDKGSDLTNNMRFLNCWLVTIKSTQLLWSQLQEVGYQCLMTRRVNTDCLENFFGSIRQQGGNCVNPTPIQFERSFRKLFCQNYFHTGSTNCADDSAVILSSLSKASTFKVSDDITPQTTLSFDFADCDYRNEETLNQNSFTYVCGYLVKKLLSVHNCTVCHQQLTQCLTLDNHTTLTYLKASSHSPPGHGGLNLPSESFLNFICKLENIFFSHFEEFALQTGIRNKYYNIMTVIPFQCDCSEFPMDYVIKLFIRLRIFYALKFTNRELITCKNKKNLKLMILSHL